MSNESLANLGRMIKRLQDETGRSASDAVTYAAMSVARSGGAASKIGKKKRDSIVNPEWKQARGSFAWARKRLKEGKAIPAEAQAALQDLNSLTPFLIVRMRQGGRPPVMLPSYEKTDPRREIERRGLAKKVWGIMYGKLGAMRETGGASGKDFKVLKYTEKYGDTAGSVAVRMINRLSYLESAYPGITQRAVSKGSSALQKHLDKRIKRATEKANA